ncbi:MAG: flagellar biosynthesis protein FlgJ [Clostridiaceae bacterium]|nr:flagellar biosynthesis protein FlgJ [Clostridiaceae bacterium]
MKIEGFGQLNYTDQIKASQAQTDAAEFESVLKKAFDEGDKKKLKEACDQFEAIMLQMLYKQMKATVPEGGLMEKSTARAMFEDMLDEALMEKSSHRGIGISDMMYRQLSAQMDRTYKIQKPDMDAPLNVNPAEPDKLDSTQPETEENTEPEVKPYGAETVED